MLTTLKRGATKEYIQKLLDRIAQEMHPTGVNTEKYCGTIKLKEDPLTIQKRMRDEWA